MTEKEYKETLEIIAAIKTSGQFLNSADMAYLTELTKAVREYERKHEVTNA